jgi:uncharacterized protein (DUF983 family)
VGKCRQTWTTVYSAQFIDDPQEQTPAPGVSAAVKTKLLARALLRRCPDCGGRDVFSSYMSQRPTCPDCYLRLDRGEPDFFIGAYTINLIVAELIVFFGGAAVLIATWPTGPWTALTYGLAGLMVLGPVVLYPFSRQLWLACDLIFRPAEATDFAGPEAAARSLRRVETT